MSATTPTQTAVSADDVRAVAAMLRDAIARAVEKKTGVMLSLEDAQGYQLVLDASADRIDTLLRYAENPQPRAVSPLGASVPETER